MSVGRSRGQNWQEDLPLLGQIGGDLTATGLLVQKPEARWTGALKADLEVSADVGTASIVMQTLVQPWGGMQAPESPRAQKGWEQGRGEATVEAEPQGSRTPTEPRGLETSLSLSPH